MKSIGEETARKDNERRTIVQRETSGEGEG